MNIKKQDVLGNERKVVLQTISTLKEKLTGGPDGISLPVIKEENRIVEPHMILFC